MQKSRIINKYFRTMQLQALGCALLLILCWSDANLCLATETNVVSRTVLRIDKANHARIMYNGLPAIVGIGDSVEFYRLDLLSGRTRITSDPWGGPLNGQIVQYSDRHFVMDGHDPIADGSSSMSVRETAPNTVDVSFSFKAPKEATRVSFDIVKVASDLCRNAKTISQPGSLLRESQIIPKDAQPLGKHILLTKKNRIIIKTALCDIEVLDLNSANSMLMADFRNAPWDRKKSIMIGVEGWSIKPGQNYVFRYLIRFMPSSDKASFSSEKPQSENVAVRQYDPLLESHFKEERIGTDFYTLQPTDAIFAATETTARTVLQADIQRITKLMLPTKNAAMSKTDRGVNFSVNTSNTDLPPDGFELTITSNNVTIRCVDARGCLYGAYALSSRITADRGAWKIACGTIRDWPDIQIRGMCTELSTPVIRDVAIMKRYLSVLSRAKCNLIVFFHEPRHILAWKKGIDDGGWTKKQAREIAAYARSLHIEIWAGMWSKFSESGFSSMNVAKGTTIYDPADDKSYDTLFTLYDQVLDVYSPSSFLIGHDEIKGLNVYAARMNRTPSEILASDVNRIRNWLQSKNVKTAMWGDMLLDYQSWEAKTGHANSQNPAFNSGQTHLAVDRISKDVIVLDWHYNNRPEYSSIAYFKKSGFTVMGCPWYDPRGASSMAKSIKRFQGAGIIGTDWGIWRTLSPASTTLYSLLAGWSTVIDVNTYDADVEALADKMREDIYAEIPTKQKQVSLAPYCNKSSRDEPPNDSLGLFNIGPALDLRFLPSGNQVFGGIDFYVIPLSDNKARNIVVVENSSLANSTKRIEIDGIQARAVAFLHTAFIEEPQANLRKLGDYLVEYQNGRRVSVDLTENYSITDIRSSEALRKNSWSFTRKPDVLIGCRTGWRGTSSIGIPLNLQTFIWKNPFPSETIRSISLRITDVPKMTKIALVGLTLLQ